MEEAHRTLSGGVAATNDLNMLGFNRDSSAIAAQVPQQQPQEQLDSYQTISSNSNEYGGVQMAQSTDDCAPSSLWVEASNSSTSILDDDHHHASSEAAKKLQLSLDELIAQQRNQELSSHKSQPYKRDPTGFQNNRGWRRGGVLNHFRQRLPEQQHFHENPQYYPSIPPPPLPSSYGPIFSQPNGTTAPMIQPRQPLLFGYSPHRQYVTAELLRRQSLQAASALRRARLYRASPYESMAGPPAANRQQLVTELLLQQQRTRKALLLAGVHPDATLGSAGIARRPKRRIEDPIVLAEQSALSDSELIYPIMIEGPEGKKIESSDDSLIIRFKGTDVLKVRKPRGDMILNSGGWKTLSTRLVLNKALKPLGIWIEEVPSCEPVTDTTMSDSEARTFSATSPSSPEWRVVDGKAFLAKFNDEMVIGNIGVTGRAQLMARASVIAQHWKQVKSTLAVSYLVINTNYTRLPKNTNAVRQGTNNFFFVNAGHQ